MLLMLDNYDSFTYNLVQYFYEMNQEVAVYRNDEITLADIESKSPDYLVISPGPCTPKDCLLYTSPSPRDRSLSRMPSSA